MKAITKDSVLSVDVLKCSKKERELVLRHFMGLTTDIITTPEVISFKKFLKAANPYKGMNCFILSESDNQKAKIIRRLKKMGYRRFGWQDGNCIFFDERNYYTLNENESYNPPDMTRLSYDQFMRWEMPEENKAEPLKFGQWDVTVTANQIKVGCKTFDKDEIIMWSRLCEEIQHYVTLEKAYNFLQDHRRELGI